MFAFPADLFQNVAVLQNSGQLRYPSSRVCWIPGSPNHALWFLLLAPLSCWLLERQAYGTSLYLAYFAALTDRVIEKLKKYCKVGYTLSFFRQFCRPKQIRYDKCLHWFNHFLILYSSFSHASMTFLICMQSLLQISAFIWPMGHCPSHWYKALFLPLTSTIGHHSLLTIKSEA